MYGAQVGLNNCCNKETYTCKTKDGCPPGICPDFIIKRHDTMPAFKVLVEDCNGALDLTDETLVLEVNIWAKAKLRKAITADDTYFQLADNIGFEQILVGDIIIMDRIRLPEHMLVTGFDEENCLVQVQRAYNGTTASAWKKGSSFKVFRTMNASASIETVLGDVIAEDGSVSEDEILETYLVYEWAGKDTCTPGCFWLEFKLIKMTEEDADISSLSFNDISNISFTPSTLSYSDFGCSLGSGVEWIRRFPTSDAFLIKVEDSPPTE